MVFGAVNTVCSGNIRWKKDSGRLRAGSIHDHFKCILYTVVEPKLLIEMMNTYFIILSCFEGFHLDMESRSLQC